MFWKTLKMMNARQAAQKAKNAAQEYFEVRFAIRSGDKNAANMLDSYKRNYSAWVGNIAQLQDYAQEAGIA